MREEGMLNELEQSLARMGRWEKLLLRILDVSEVAFHCSDELPVP